MTLSGHSSNIDENHVTKKEKKKKISWFRDQRCSIEIGKYLFCDFRGEKEEVSISVVFFYKISPFYNLNAVTFCQKVRSGEDLYKIL